MTQKIRVKINTTKRHLELAKDAVTVHEGLKGNAAFPPNPPVALDTFKTAIDAYTTAISAAADGSKKAMAERDSLKHDVAAMLRQLGHWVEANCNQDRNILQSSGFQPAAINRAPQGPLPQPVILKIQNGAVSGQMLVQVRPLPRARAYEVRYTRKGADGQPEAWTVLPPYANTRNLSVNGLTPGAAYQFQVRAFGKVGLTDWSDAANRIAI